MTDFIVRSSLKADDVVIYRGKDLFKDDPRLDDLLNFGMPSDVERILLLAPGASVREHLRDFKMQYFGLPVDALPSTLFEMPKGKTVLTPDTSLPIGAFMSYVRQDDAEQYVQAWLHRVFYKEQGAYIEELWHPQNGWLTHIEAVQRSPIVDRIQDVQKLATALLSLSEFSKQQARLEGWITEAIERMAKAQTNPAKPRPFSKTDFVKSFPYSTSRSNIYNIVPEELWPNIEERYYRQCSKIASS